MACSQQVLFGGFPDVRGGVHDAEVVKVFGRGQCKLVEAQVTKRKKEGLLDARKIVQRAEVARAVTRHDRKLTGRKGAGSEQLEVGSRQRWLEGIVRNHNDSQRLLLVGEASAPRDAMCQSSESDLEKLLDSGTTGENPSLARGAWLTRKSTECNWQPNREITPGPLLEPLSAGSSPLGKDAVFSSGPKGQLQTTSAPLRVASASFVKRQATPSGRFFACFIPKRCRLAAVARVSLARRKTPTRVVGAAFKHSRLFPGGMTAASYMSEALVTSVHVPRRTCRGSETGTGSFSSAAAGDLPMSWEDDESNAEGRGEFMEGGIASEMSSGEIAPQDTSKRKPGWFFRILGVSGGEETMWKVPWTGSTIFQVMFLWFAAFWLVGSWAVPAAAHALGFDRSLFTYRGQAIYSLVTDIAEMLVGLGILMRCLARFRPPVAAGWFWFFPFKWSPGFWILDTVVGCLLFPIVNMLSQINTELLPLPGTFPGGSPLEQSLSAKDPIANLLYVVVVSVCAPIWEEIIFRGFLLASLNRYLPLWGSVGVSALVFALAHFSLQRLLPLSFLGIVMGVIFVRSRNLLACMVLHSMWNAFVFLELLR